MTNNIRQHVILAIITLILAVIILVLLFIPRQPQMRYIGPPPGGSGQIISSQQA